MAGDACKRNAMQKERRAQRTPCKSHHLAQRNVMKQKYIMKQK